jgi:hypothetical protein
MAVRTRATAAALFTTVFCSGLAVTPAAAAVITADAATFVFAGMTCTVQRPFCEVPGASTSFDVEFTNGLKEIAEAAATPFGPVVSVRGLSAGPSFASSFAQAEARWEVSITPIGAGLVLQVTAVPVTFQVNAFADASGDDAGAQAGVSSPLGVISVCDMAGPNGSFCDGIDGDSASVALAGNLSPDRVYELDMVAFGGARGNSEFQATADPVLQISDLFIPGTDIRYSDAFIVSVSPDVTQSIAPLADVPEPGTSSLLVVALAVLLGCRVQARRGKAGAMPR